MGGAVRLADVVRAPVRWLWPGRIPLGKLTVLDGDPGLGKSAIALDLAARVTRCAPFPDGTTGDLTRPATVVLLSAEDGLADTVRPRLEAAGADLQRVIALTSGEGPQPVRPLLLPRDYPLLAQLVRQARARLLVVDPLMAYLDLRVNPYRDQVMRQVLAPLALIARHTGCAVLLVRHLTKGSEANPLYRGGGSIGIIGGARSGLLVAPDPDDPRGERRVLAVFKGNLAAGVPALAYRLGQVELPPAPPPPAAASAARRIRPRRAARPARTPPAPPASPPRAAVRVVWEGAVEHSARRLLQPDLGAPDPALSDARAEALAFLADLLAGGPQPSRAVFDAARRAGITIITLRRAKVALGVVAERERFGPAGSWWWRLPAPNSAAAPSAPASPDTSLESEPG